MVLCDMLTDEKSIELLETYSIIDDSPNIAKTISNAYGTNQASKLNIHIDIFIQQNVRWMDASNHRSTNLFMMLELFEMS